MSKKKIVIIDYGEAKTYITDIDTDVYDEENIQDFFDQLATKLGHKLHESNCAWMVQDSIEDIKHL